MKGRANTRRQFHKQAVAGALALAAGAPTPAAAQAETLKSSAAALCDLLEARYGKLLTAEQLEQVKRSVRSDLVRFELLKRIPLENSDEPAFVFRADL